MGRLVTFSVVLLLAVLASSPTLAQGTCLQSFNVKQNKPLLTYDWLPERPESTQIITCLAAERLREKIYIDNKTQIEAAANGSPALYVTAAESSAAEAEAKVRDLEAAIKRNEPRAGLLLAGEVVLYELGKAEFLISCIAPEATVSKLFCGAGFIAIGLQSYRIITGTITNNEFQQIVADSNAKLKEARIQLATLKAKLNSTNFKEIAAKNRTRFDGLCAAIMKDCL